MQMFFCEHYEIFNSTYFVEHLRTGGSASMMELLVKVVND